MNKFTIFELFINRNVLVKTVTPLTINVEKDDNYNKCTLYGIQTAQ